MFGSADVRPGVHIVGTAIKRKKGDDGFQVSKQVGTDAVVGLELGDSGLNRREIKDAVAIVVFVSSPFSSTFITGGRRDISAPEILNVPAFIFFSRPGVSPILEEAGGGVFVNLGGFKF